MPRNVVLPPTTVDPPYLRPWVVLLAGLGLVVVGLGLSSLDGHSATVARAIFLAIGLFTVGAAISRRLQTAGGELEQRVESAGMLAAGAFAALLAYMAIKKEDDCSSGEYFLIGIIVIALTGAVLVVLPTLYRKILVSVWILFHFAGIFVAIVNVDPPGTTQPWLTQQLWVRVYLHYLGYTYMTNAYHFYSPEPGPTTLVWFRVEYEDGSFRWVKFPDKKEAEVPLAYTRRMVLGDGTVVGPQLLSPALSALRTRDRTEAGMVFTPEPTKDGQKFQGQPIPIVPGGFNAAIPPDAYKEPGLYGKILTASYARHVAKSYPHTEDPSIPVKNVKVYSITHRIILPGEMAQGHNEMEETFLIPYYMGTFDRDGKLMFQQQQYDQQGQPLSKKKDADGFLYWTLPVILVPRGPGGDLIYPHEAKDFVIHNYMKLHAGDIRSFDDGPKKDEPKEEIKAKAKQGEGKGRGADED